MKSSSQFVRDGRSLLAQLAKPDRPSLLPSSLSVGAVIIFLTLADLITLKTLFNATFTDQPAVIWILSGHRGSLGRAHVRRGALRQSVRKGDAQQNQYNLRDGRLPAWRRSCSPCFCVWICG